MTDGTGGMPFGPADIVVEGNRITEVRPVGAREVPIDEADRPAGGIKWVMKDGIVYDAEKLRADVRAMFDEQESATTETASTGNRN